MAEQADGLGGETVSPHPLDPTRLATSASPRPPRQKTQSLPNFPELAQRPRLIVGLGNPGSRYVRTRHNAGFLAVEGLATKLGADWQSSPKWQGLVARNQDLFLLLPQTFMNLSGQAVAALAAFYKIPPAAILVVLDDFALPFGKLRLRTKGSEGGHNGLRSIIEHLGTTEFPRLRLGIGPLPPDEKEPAPKPLEGWADFVLAPFTPTELALLPDLLKRSTALLLQVLSSPAK